MTSSLVIALVSLIGACLTLFSGFGLGTLLVPVFSLFFPVELAVVLTAIVHFLNNLLKLALFGRQANLQVLLRFGLPSVPAAVLGAYLLSALSSSAVLYTYTIYGRVCDVTPVKLTIAILLMFFSLFEIVPALKHKTFDTRYLPLGGLLSGFFGGLSGNQGALRSAFLIRAGLSKESFIATGVVMACLIDCARLSMYYINDTGHSDAPDLSAVTVATLAAFLGTFIGAKLLKKVTIAAVQLFVSVMLLLFALLLGAGII